MAAEGYLGVLEWIVCESRDWAPHHTAAAWLRGRCLDIYISDSDRTVPAELGKESQAFSCVEERNSAQGVHRGSRHHLICAPSPLLIETGGSIPLLCLQGVPNFPAHLRMRPVSRGNSRRATWVVPHTERPRCPGPLLRRPRGPDPSSKAT